MTELLSILNRLTYWLRLRDSIETAQISLWGFCLAALFIQLIGWILPIANLTFLTLAPIGLWLFLVISLSLLRRLTPLQVAKRLDQELGLKQRLSTSVALQHHDYDQAEKSFAAILAAQREDSLFHAQKIIATHDLPIQWMKKPLGLAVVIIMGVALLITLPNPMESILAQRQIVAQTAKDQSEKLENLKDELKENEDISPELQMELAKKLEELSAALKDNQGDLEQALAEISDVEAAFKERLIPENQTRAMNLMSLASQLAKLSDNSNNNSDTDIQQAIQALDELSDKAAELSQADQDQLSMNFAQMAAQASQSGDLQLAQALSSLSQNLKSGDSNSISEAIDRVQSSMVQTQQTLNNQQALSLTIDQLNSSSQALAQAGQSGNGQPLASIPNQNSSSSTNNSAASSSNPMGGGSKADTLPPAQGVGQAGSPQGPAVNNIDDSPDEQIYAPRLTGAEIGEPLFIPGVNLDEGSTDVIEGGASSLGLSKPVFVPYNQIYYEYLRTANQTMDQIAIPASLENFVRSYFTQLEP